jgi:hypothetical protein
MFTQYPMVTRARFSRFAALGLAAGFLGLAQSPLAAAPAKTSPPAATNSPAAAVVIPRSEFNEKLPQGRVPFFPRSTRRVPVVASPSTNAVGVVQRPQVDTSQFLLKGISGSASRRLAIINDRTFAAGEDQEVTTRTGKMLIHCQEIRDSSVLISFGNPPQSLELRLPGAF